jgi:hypothetical protein
MGTPELQVGDGTLSYARLLLAFDPVKMVMALTLLGRRE